jgi:hypothetical protein
MSNKNVGIKFSEKYSKYDSPSPGNINLFLDRVQTLCFSFLTPTGFQMIGFPIIWLWSSMMKVVLDTPRALN